MSEVKQEKPGEYLIGLGLGAAVGAAAWFLYKTKKGKKLRYWWDHYFNELRDEWAKWQAVEGEIVSRPPSPTSGLIRRPKPKKNTFHQSGKPLVK